MAFMHNKSQHNRPQSATLYSAMNNDLLRKIGLILSTCVVLNSYSSEFEYIQPNEISAIPKNYADILTSEGCSIPRWIEEFGGLTKGQFAQSGQFDLAVLCKNEKGNSIRIFWGGEASCPDTIDSYGEFIDTVGEKYIIDHYQTYGGDEPPKITHEAINDHFVEKASTVRYCHNQKWLELRGAD